MMKLGLGGAVVVMLLSCAISCGSSGSKGGTGGKGGGGSGGTAGASGSGGATGGVAGSDAAVADAPVDQGQAADAPAQDAAPDGAGDAVSACPVDGAVVADPFAGVWTGVQSNETYTFTNSGGCTSWTGTVSGVVCDVCTGTYAKTDAGVAAATLQCHPVGACSVSPAHTDTGFYKLAGCSLTYDYNYGGGSSTVGATRASETTTNVCAQLDAGTD